MRAQEWRAEYLQMLNKFNFDFQSYEEHSDIDTSELYTPSADEIIQQGVEQALSQCPSSSILDNIPTNPPIPNLSIFCSINYNNISLVESYLKQLNDNEVRRKFREFLAICHDIPMRSTLLLSSSGSAEQDNNIEGEGEEEEEEEEEKQQTSLQDNITQDQQERIKSSFRKKNANYLPLANKFANNISNHQLKVRPHEVILVFQLRSIHNESVQQEFEILGSHSLADLKDSIYCVHSQLNDKFLLKNPYFFIEGHIYIDKDMDETVLNDITSILQWIDINQSCVKFSENKRRKTSGCYEANLREQMARYIHKCKQDENIQQVQVQDMIRCEDIDVELNTRYLFCHDGGCEHFLYLTDMRIHNPCTDLPLRDDYPRLTQQAKMQRRRCGICDVWSAKFIVYNDRLANRSPEFFCPHCYHNLHYAADGTLLYDDFIVFPYVHDMT